MYEPPSQKIGPLTEKPTLETVAVAIKTVLSHDPNTDRRPAQVWLEALKASIYAWEICDQLLSSHNGIEVSYLAAHMLRQKISKNFNELPKECYLSLRDSILNHLQTNEDYAVQGQLTVAIADLTLLLQDWQNPIEDMAKHLGLDVGLMSLINSDYAAILKALHNRLIFAYIMHQMCDLNHNNSERPCRIGAKRREEFEDYLITKCNQAITWWLNTLKETEELRLKIDSASTSDDGENSDRLYKIIETNDKLVGQIFLCYSAWLRIFDEENVNESLPLIDSSFKYLNKPECSDHIHKYAVEVIKATANYCSDNRIDYLIDHLVQQVYPLEQAYKQTVVDEDVEKSTNLVRAFSSVAETAFVPHVMERKDFRLIQLMLNCLNHYDFEVVEETYSFWWLFLENLQYKLKQSECSPYIESINKFVVSVTKLCQFDPDEDTVISQDQDIHGFRATSAEIISNAMYVTTVGDFISDNSILENLLLENSWEKVESILFLISCLVQMMTREENSLRDRIFQSILKQQTKIQDLHTLLTCEQLPIRIGTSNGEIHPQVVATTLRIISSLNSFLADFPDYLIVAIKYILNAIHDTKHRSQLIKFAANALSEVMELNASRHLNSYPELLIIVKQLCTSLDEFDEQAAAGLLRCSAYMSDAIEDVDLKDQFLCEILRPITNSLKDNLNSTDRSQIDPSKHMDRLSSVFKQASIHPSKLPSMNRFVTYVDTELWPVIVQTLAGSATTRGNTIERTCRTIRYLIRCIKPEWMIERIAETMINLYKTYPQNSSPLYICSILVDEFANRSPEINQGLFAMLEIFCTLTFTLLNMNASQSKSLLTMKSYPETIDDMMRLFNRFMKKCPSDFVNCKALESIIELCISSLRIDHPDANAHVSKFVASFIALGQSGDYIHISDAIKNILGARFTDAVIKACLFDIPSNLIGEEAQILLALISFDKNLFNTWIEASVSTLPKTNIQGIESVTPDQLEDFKKTITTAGSLKKIVNCLRAFARLYT